MSTPAPLKKEPKSFARRDRLIEIEKKVQKKWDDLHVYDIDAPEDLSTPKYFATFPYPYMNGKLHLGHAFSLTKAEFSTRFQRLNGKQALFPFGFHCTGMPIKAAADKIKKEIATFGNPPKFPENDKVVRQWTILQSMGIPDSEIPQFADGYHWLLYFPPIAEEHLKRFGVCSDFRRSFITTDLNPYYDSFIRWQFELLKEGGRLSFGKRYSIFSPTDNQICADHDRATGEGVMPKEYTIVKIEVVDPYPSILDPIFKMGKKVYLGAATLRPETMYGQTNCWLQPEGEYGAFEINDTEVLIISERAALNLSYQGFSKEKGKVSCLLKCKGQDLMNCALKAPNAIHEKIYVLPMDTISMDKTTGVVTSVPSDSPDDYATFMDLKNKANYREKYHIKEESILPFDVISIIDIKTLDTDKVAVQLYEKLKIKSHNDSKLLAEAKDVAYLEGFNNGVMKVGKYAGKSVKEAKELIKKDLIAEGTAIPYSEPESEVISRSGDVCVVAHTDQWFIKYGDASWKPLVEKMLNTQFRSYNSQTIKELKETVDWLREWGCSRSFGLGTKLPWDTNYLIESLSDSTIYMAYYTVAHFLQEGVLDGSKGNKLGIKPEQLTRKVWDYIFLKDKPYPEDCGIAKESLDKLKREFNYWYPFDVRVSGKDLIKNHLTMSLYNHTAIWENEPEKWPRSIFANGYIMVNGEKMSKSKGNFITLEDLVGKYSTDASRIALADAGDTHDDANFEELIANSSILRLDTHLSWIEESLQLIKSGAYRKQDNTIFQDRVFESKINRAIRDAGRAYENMQFREALKAAWYDYETARDEYRLETGENGVAMREDLILRYIEVGCVILAPICPHIADHIWCNVLKKSEKSIWEVKWPSMSALGIDEAALTEHDYFKDAMHNFRQKLQKDQKNPSQKLTNAYIYVCDAYPGWQVEALKILQEGKGTYDMKAISDKLKGKIEPKMIKNAMSFIATKQQEFTKVGLSAFSSELTVKEKEVMERNKRFIEQQFGLAEGGVKIFTTSQPAEEVIDPTNKRGAALPQKPIAHFIFNQ